MPVVLKRPKTVFSPANAGHSDVLTGLPFSELEKFEKKSGLSPESIQKVLHLTPAVRAKRKLQKRLSMIESERLVRLDRILKLATDLYEGDRPTAARWIETPQRVLSGDSPIVRAQTEIGARDVEQFIGRLEQGVYS